MGLVYPETLMWFIPEKDTLLPCRRKYLDGQDRCPVYPETSGFRWRSIQ